MIPKTRDTRCAEQERRVQRAIKMAKMMKSPAGNPDMELTEMETMAAKLEAISAHNGYMARMVTEANKERDTFRQLVHNHKKEKMEWEEEVTEWRKKFDECYSMYQMVESLWKDELDKKKATQPCEW